MVHPLGTFVEQRCSWLLLGLSATALVFTALYFQYGMDLQPCVKCIYQRTAMLVIALASIPAILAPKALFARLVGFTGWLGASSWGFLIAYEHDSLQNSKNAYFAVCEGAPNFPEWLPLVDWLPEFFSAPGLCGDIDWQFLGLSMPGWMTVIFGLYASASILVITLRLLRFKRL